MADESLVLNLNNCIGLKPGPKSNPPQKPTRISNPPCNMLLFHPRDKNTTPFVLGISKPFKNDNLETTKTFVWVMGKHPVTSDKIIADKQRLTTNNR